MAATSSSEARVAPEIVNRSCMALAEVSDLGVQVIIAPGNHDRSRLPSSIWLGHPNIHVLDQPRSVLIHANDLTVAIGGFPFVPGDIRESLPRQLEQTGLARVPADVRLLCMHQTVAGARVGPNGFEFRAGPEVISRASLPRAMTAVLAGHIHRARSSKPGRAARLLSRVYRAPLIRGTKRAQRVLRSDVHCQPGGEAVVAEADFIELLSPDGRYHASVGAVAAEVGRFLTQAARQCPTDAVVRIIAGDDPAPAIAQQLTAALLRSCLPPR
jgi:hypothetical protein